MQISVTCLMCIMHNCYRKFIISYDTNKQSCTERYKRLRLLFPESALNGIIIVSDKKLTTDFFIRPILSEENNIIM